MYNIMLSVAFIDIFLVFVSQCFPGCLTIQIRTALCILIVLLIYAVAQACVVSGKGNSKNVTSHLTGQLFLLSYPIIFTPMYFPVCLWTGGLYAVVVG